MKKITFFLMMIGSISSLLSQSNTVQMLKDSGMIRQSLYFNASTLRMLNLQKDPAVDELVKGVDKLSLWVMDNRKFTRNEFFNTAEKLQNEEQYEEYLVMDGNEYNLQVVGKPKKQEMIGLINAENSSYVFKLKGTIDLMQLPEIWEKMSQVDTSSLNIFTFLKDRVMKEEADLQRWEERRKEWEERERREAMKADSIKAANIAIDSTKLTPENE